MSTAKRDDLRRQPARRTMDTLVAFNQGESAVAELIGAERAREIFARQEAVAACRRRAASNPALLNMRIG